MKLAVFDTKRGAQGGAPEHLVRVRVRRVRVRVRVRVRIRVGVTGLHREHVGVEAGGVGLQLILRGVRTLTLTLTR